MVKNLLFLIFSLTPLLVIGNNQKKQLTILSCQVYDSPGDKINFDCAQDISLKAEFYKNPGENHTYSFETDRLVTMFVNGTELILEPGDSLNAVIRYGENRRVSSIFFSGTDQAIANNNLYRKSEDFRRSSQYKEQLLACAVVDMKPAARIADSRVFLAGVNAMVAATKDYTSEGARNFVLSAAESKAYLSFIEYPVMYASIRKVPIEEQGIGDFWTIADEIKLREDAASLSCYPYCGFIMQYYFYAKRKEAHAKGLEYERPHNLETLYSEFSTYFKGPIRDMLLFTVLANYIRQGRELERAEVLIKDYTKKYNKNKVYPAQLKMMLQ